MLAGHFVGQTSSQERKPLEQHRDHDGNAIAASVYNGPDAPIVVILDCVPNPHVQRVPMTREGRDGVN